MAVDYTNMGPNGPITIANADRRWWLAKGDDLAQSITAVINTLARYDSPRQTQYQISTRLYGNVNLMGLNGLSFTKISAITSATKDRVTYNIVQSCIDTVTSKMAKNRPKPLFLTSGGNYRQQRKAKKLDRFMEGIFYENDVYKLSTQIFRDCGVFGDGIIHVFAENNRIKYERVIASEIYVDAVDGFYGKPRQMHRTKNVDRAVLMDMFPEYKDKISIAKSASADLMGTYQNIADLITVVESWHLPSGPNAKDGMHTITITDCVLFVEDYKKNFFPFVFLHWSKRLYGVFGQGLAEQLQSIQLEVNKILWVIQRSFHMFGTYKVWLKTGSKIPKEHVNNDIGTIMVGDEPPQYLNSSPVPQEYFMHLQTLKNQAFEQAGISQLSAASKKPSGLDSGRALREFNDIESERFMAIGQQYQQMFLDLAKISISIAKDIYAEDKKFSVQVPGKKFIDTIQWKDVDMEEDEFVLKMFPVSSLPSDPAGRLQTITEYLQAGFLSPRQGRRLLDFPDLEAEESLANAQEDWLHACLEKIVDESEYTVPEPEMDLLLADELALEYYAQGKNLGLEEEKLEMIRTFRDQIGILKQKMQGPPPMPMQLGQPQAVPMAPPVSNMLPNVPQQ